MTRCRHPNIHPTHPRLRTPWLNFCPDCRRFLNRDHDHQPHEEVTASD